MIEPRQAKDLGVLRELLLVNLIQLDTLTQLLIERGLITEERFLHKLKEVRSQYHLRGRQISEGACGKT